MSEKCPSPKEAIVFVVAHPDDLAHAMGGTAWLLKDRYDLHVYCATRGQNGIRGTSKDEAAAIRSKEEQAACDLLGAQLTLLEHEDGVFFADRETCSFMAEELGRLQPKAVFSLWPLNRHPDHVAAFTVASKALQMAGLLNTTEFYMGENGLQVTLNFSPDYYVDITDVVEEKKSLARCHASQNPNEEKIEGVIKRNQTRGMFGGGRIAEAFKTWEPIAVHRDHGIKHSVLSSIRDAK